MSKYQGPRVKDTDTFIQKARWVHGDEYDYSSCNYNGSSEKVEIICKTHGPFYQRAQGHLSGKGCKSCQYENVSSKLSFSTEDFIKKSQEVHGNKYDYSKSNYLNKEEKVCIICPSHGDFWQRAGSHMRGKGCNKCKYEQHGDIVRISYKEIIKRCKETHGDTYIYPKQTIKRISEKLHIVCRNHGSFYQSACNHFNLGHGCPKCKGEKHAERSSFDIEVFMSRSKCVHGDRYDYSKVVYKNSNSPVEIICEKHGSFFQTPHSHWDGRNCPKCSQESITESQRYNKVIFVEKAEEIHGKTYNYDSVEYVDSVTKVDIECPQHGKFSMMPSSHWAGQGCPKCANLRKGFGSYRVSDGTSNIYLIRLYNNEEDFLKIGLAKKPNVRHSRIQRESDYSIDILRCHESSSRAIFDLEKSILENNKFKKYVPKQTFQGYTECFSLDSYEVIDELLEVCFDL